MKSFELLAFLSIPFLLCDHAYGYIDPGMGGFALQIVMAAFAGIAFRFVRLFRSRQKKA